MAGNVKVWSWNPNRLRDLALDIAVPLLFAVLTAGFFVLAAR